MRVLLRQFDTKITVLVQAAPQWLHGPMLFITNAGQPAVLIAAALFVAGLAFAQGDMGLVAASAIVPLTNGVTALLKLYWRRVRPETEYVRNMLIPSFSFPSGHATGAMIGCGFFAYLVWYFLLQPWATIATVILMLLIFLIGISRVYLGAHFPSDVVGGWLVGVLGLVVVVFIIKPF